MKTPEPDLNAFTPAELEVMQALWKHGEMKPAEILELVERSPSNAALRSVLRILTEKGHLSRRLQGKAYYYKPTRSRHTALKNLTRSLSEIFCGGSPAALITHLIKTEELSPEEVRELEELARSKSKSKSQS
ncbi:MAG: BlaI/MecI/CopY family transcriptional regulator [Verrucomicrobiota bacterium]